MYWRCGDRYVIRAYDLEPIGWTSVKIHAIFVYWKGNVYESIILQTWYLFPLFSISSISTSSQIFRASVGQLDTQAGSKLIFNLWEHRLQSLVVKVMKSFSSFPWILLGPIWTILIQFVPTGRLFSCLQAISQAWHPTHRFKFRNRPIWVVNHLLLML